MKDLPAREKLDLAEMVAQYLVLAGSLDMVARWDRDFGLGEQERLRYARLLLARPKWLICDEGLDPLDETNRQILLSILGGELGETAVINISQRREPTDFYHKVVSIAALPSSHPAPGPHKGKD